MSLESAPNTGKSKREKRPFKNKVEIPAPVVETPADLTETTKKEPYTPMGKFNRSIYDNAPSESDPMNSLNDSNRNAFNEAAFAYRDPGSTKKPIIESKTPVIAPVVETPAPVVAPKTETPRATPVVETPVVAPKTETPRATPVIETPVIETPVVAPVLETPAPVVEAPATSTTQEVMPGFEPIPEVTTPQRESATAPSTKVSETFVGRIVDSNGQVRSAYQGIVPGFEFNNPFNVNPKAEAPRTAPVVETPASVAVPVVENPAPVIETPARLSDEEFLGQLLDNPPIEPTTNVESVKKTETETKLTFRERMYKGIAAFLKDFINTRRIIFHPQTGQAFLSFEGEKNKIPEPEFVRFNLGLPKSTVETPVAETPVAETPVAETPVAETPAPARLSDEEFLGRLLDNPPIEPTTNVESSRTTETPAVETPAPARLSDEEFLGQLLDNPTTNVESSRATESPVAETPARISDEEFLGQLLDNPTTNVESSRTAETEDGRITQPLKFDEETSLAEISSNESGISEQILSDLEKLLSIDEIITVQPTEFREKLYKFYKTEIEKFKDIPGLSYFYESIKNFNIDNPGYDDEEYLNAFVQRIKKLRITFLDFRGKISKESIK